ncbi:MAG: UDP-N-acetylmuramoyl-tripeptide--D-alanyl-D-alanine ligase [Phycisphaerales bacterium]
MNQTDTATTTGWTPAWLQHVTGGRWLKPPRDLDTALTGLGIDSRAIKPGQVFLAVKGENFDGHDYANKARQAGAAVAIIEREDAAVCTDTPGGVLLVSNTIDALHRLAASYREALRQSGCTVIAVVGSNGKTTTRHLIHAVLSSSFKGTQSPKSFNNHLGVPLTVLGAATDDRFVVAEVGTNHPGEIAALGKLLQPDAVVVTCIGHEHMEFFGDLQGVAEEEASISRFISPDGVMFIESEARKWIEKSKSFKYPAEPVIFGFGKDGATQHRQLINGRQRFAISDSTDIDLPLLAPHDINNALAAVAVGRWMGMDDPAIKYALENVRPMPGRLEVKPFGPVTVIDDTYNANPDSMRAALDVLATYPVAPGGRRVAVLADMLELGALTEQAHREVGSALARMLIDGIIQHVSLVGPLMATAAKAIQQTTATDRMTHEPDPADQTIQSIAVSIRPGDVVLCKGSRGLRLERLMPIIRDRFA